MPLTAQELAKIIGATLVGDGGRLIERCAPIERAAEGEVTFLANRKYLPHLQTTRAAAVILSARSECPNGLTRLLADDPYYAFRNAMIALHGFREHPSPISRADTAASPAQPGSASEFAVIHATAQVSETASIHPHVTIERGASVGAGTILYPGVYVGCDARIGADCILHPNAVVYDRCVVGNRVTLHSSVVIGSDGFGYATHAGAHHKIPQTGIAVIEDEVELGAGCVIERAAMGETRIGRGTKFADLISIGHGTTIGEHCLLVSLVGVSGSVEVGNYVVLGGQVGVAGHIRVGHGVQAMARTAIAQDVPDGQKIGGAPAVPSEQAKRNALAASDLYSLFKRVRRLERRLDNASEDDG